MTSSITMHNIIKALIGVSFGAYFVYSFISFYSLLHLLGATYTLYIFIGNPDLFQENKRVISQRERPVMPPLDVHIVRERSAPPRKTSAYPSAYPSAYSSASYSSMTPRTAVERIETANPTATPTSKATPLSRASYIPSKKTRQHRVPVIAARKESPLTTSSPLPGMMDSPCGYESDSSHASSSSSGRSSSSATLGLPTYEKHSTVIFTMAPKRPGYVPQVQAILKTARNSWLALPGSVSHEVGQDTETGSVIVVETYESNDHMSAFDKSQERDKLINRLKPFIDDRNIGIVRMPASSAVTRAR